MRSTETGATGLEPATSGVTGATQRTVQTARFRYLMRIEGGAASSATTTGIAVNCARFDAVWAPVPNGSTTSQTCG
jgi:hypothetical protein